jgi:protein SCO1
MATTTRTVVTRYSVYNVKRRIYFVSLAAILIVLASCTHSAPVTKRYPLTGRVVSIDTQSQSAIIDADAIPGFMDAMAMPYTIKPASALNQLAVGDSISAEVVVVAGKNQDAAPEYWIENVKVTAHGAAAKSASSVPHMPTPGEEVPDFRFTNQSGKKTSLGQYRGQTLIVTFVYTRCPFPDFCPRMSSNFNEIYNQLGTNSALAHTHLLELSFDPEHDTPKVLRDYGFSVAHTHDSALFERWEFAVPTAAELPKIADFFALTIQPDNGKPETGVITHTLSTAVIGPDGKIVQWYHGGDWQVSQLVKDASGSVVPKS